VLQRWFTPKFLAARPAAVERLDAMLRATPAEGYAGCCEAIRDMDLTDRLGSITAPTLVIAGAEDPATRRAARPGDRQRDPGRAARHRPARRPPGERRAAAGRSPTGFWPMSADDGMRVRREGAGDEHVDRAIERTTEFTADFQDLITRYAWGEIWTRPGLDRRTRSCITLTALVALNHHDELAMHVPRRAAQRLSPDEIKEVLLQAAIYCGVPAANAAFAIAQRVLDEADG
jgi:3-oxoadipate enol-lactonase/4-carboxymuconolactone decarboxylase